MWNYGYCEEEISIIGIRGVVVNCNIGKLDAMTDDTLKMMWVFTEIEENMFSERIRSEMINIIAKGKVIERLLIIVDN